MIDPILKVFKALNSDVGPWQLSFAVALGLVIGLTPLWSVHNIIVLLLAFILRVHISTFFVFWAVFSGLAYLLDPWFHQLGSAWLTAPNLTPMWTQLYQSQWWQVAHFNHTITLGSLAVSLAAFFPVAVLFRLSVVKYRASMMPWVNKLKVVQVLKGSKLYELYSRAG
ncbi:DUF2062 domain-containing protein [Reinekea marina]|uniref:DUF2062 domain-containing protein n=1 Tax=Reinekea marina TaxID=1310421 RepID=A0ABV7WRZ6_9GAMM|nr:DUF2062 domain-containing protein [Reinekea marina]MDN3649205.1 DUF2062 domain-containing protein [Reinekea marina]